MRNELIGKRKKRENQRNGNPQNFALFARDDCRSEVTGALPDDDCSGLTLYHTGLGFQSERPGAASPPITSPAWQIFAGFRFVDFRVFSLFRSPRFSYGSSDLEGARFSHISTNVSHTSLISGRKVEEAKSTTATHEGTILEVLWETLTWRVENGARVREVLWATSAWRIEILKKIRALRSGRFGMFP